MLQHPAVDNAGKLPQNQSASCYVVDLELEERMRRIRLVYCAIGLLALSACEDNPGSPAGSFTQMYHNVIVPLNCALCHSAGGSAQITHGIALDLSSQSLAYQSLMNNQVSDVLYTPTCGSVSYVVAGRPTSSYLAAVLDPRYNQPDFAGVSGCYPLKDHLAAYPLSAVQLNLLEGWIVAGLADD